MSVFSILKSGIPILRRPPILSFFSNTTTECPALANCCAQAKPDGPDPMTATFLSEYLIGN